MANFFYFLRTFNNCLNLIVTKYAQLLEHSRKSDWKSGTNNPVIIMHEINRGTSILWNKR